MANVGLGEKQKRTRCLWSCSELRTPDCLQIWTVTPCQVQASDHSSHVELQIGRDPNAATSWKCAGDDLIVVCLTSRSLKPAVDHSRAVCGRCMYRWRRHLPHARCETAATQKKLIFRAGQFGSASELRLFLLTAGRACCMK